MTELPNMSQGSVLVIDDEPHITEIIDTFLNNSGFEVHVSNAATEGLKLAKQLKPDVILLDIMMPEVDGYSLCNDLKNDNNTSGIPVFFLTGKDRNDDMGRSFKVGGDMFIKKPFSCERLLEILNIILLSTKH